MKRLLILPKIRVQNANALSSPYTIGFPAMTAWLGAMHALERKMNHSRENKIFFQSLGVVCHQMDLQTYKGHKDYVYSVIGTGNPLDKSGKRPSFIEEARCHLTVSLVIEYSEEKPSLREQNLLEPLEQQMNQGWKVTGGDVLSFETPEIKVVDEEKDLAVVRRKLMPGYAIVERRDLMTQEMEDGKTALEALLENLKVTHKYDLSEEKKWTVRRKNSGWLVPIATGFHGVSDISEASHQRQEGIPHRFAESVVTLGEFIMPYKIKSMDEILWRYHVDHEKNLYLCEQCKK